MVYCVGLTGTVASGKSTVAKIFNQLGVDLICSDNLAKTLTTQGMPAFDAVVTHFGKTILLKNGELNRRLLRKIIFNNEEERLWLEKLLHPLIRNTIVEEIQRVKSPYCVIEIPLLYRKIDFPYLNTVLGIKTPDNIAIMRIMQRDHCSKAEAEGLLALQKNKIHDESLLDKIIVNTGSLIDLEEQVFCLHNQYLRKAKQMQKTV